MGESEQADGAEDIRGGDVEPADPVSEEVAAPVGAGEPADDAESTDESVSMGDADATAGEGEALPEAELDDEDQPAARKFSGPAPPAEEAKGTEPTADDDATVARRRKKKKRR